jgi:CheY-like chemotaxis protein
MRGKLAPDDEVEGEGDIEILVVDDDPAICASLSGILREAGFSVDTSSNGNDALRRCLHNDFIAVISDIQMPGMDGFALATAIRAEVRRVPFLIGMTAFEARQRTDQRSAVFDGFLGKPFSEDALLDLVDQALERGRN